MNPVKELLVSICEEAGRTSDRVWMFLETNLLPLKLEVLQQTISYGVHLFFEMLFNETQGIAFLFLYYIYIYIYRGVHGSRIETRVRHGRLGVRIPAGQVISKYPDRLLGLPNFLFGGYRGFSSEVKWSGRDVDQSPPSSAEIKNEWRYTSAPPLCLHGVRRDKLAFLP